MEAEANLPALDFIACSALIGKPDAKGVSTEIVNIYMELPPEAKQKDPDKVCAEILKFYRAEMSACQVPDKVRVVLVR